MTKPRTRNLQIRLTTSEMVVYPMIVAVLIAVAFGFYQNSKIDDAVSAAVDVALEQRAMADDILIGDTPKAKRRRKRFDKPRQRTALYTLDACRYRRGGQRLRA